MKGDYCVGSLGFRAARSLHAPPVAPVPAITFTTPYDLPGEWRTQDGKAVRLASLRGKVHVLTMGFTRCKFACPRTLGDMHSIEQALGTEAGKTGFVFLSIDPQHDTPERLAQTIKERHLDPARWTFLTAPEDVVQQTAVALNFQLQMIDGLFAHSNLIAVLDRDGNIVHREEALGADLAPTIAAVRKLFAVP